MHEVKEGRGERETERGGTGGGTRGGGSSPPLPPWLLPAALYSQFTGQVWCFSFFPFSGVGLKRHRGRLGGGERALLSSSPVSSPFFFLFLSALRGYCNHFARFLQGRDRGAGKKAPRQWGDGSLPPPSKTLPPQLLAGRCLFFFLSPSPVQGDSCSSSSGQATWNGLPLPLRIQQGTHGQGGGGGMSIASFKERSGVREAGGKEGVGIQILFLPKDGNVGGEIALPPANK